MSKPTFSDAEMTRLHGIFARRYGEDRQRLERFLSWLEDHSFLLTTASVEERVLSTRERKQLRAIGAAIKRLEHLVEAVDGNLRIVLNYEMQRSAWYESLAAEEAGEFDLGKDQESLDDELVYHYQEMAPDEQRESELAEVSVPLSLDEWFRLKDAVAHVSKAQSSPGRPPRWNVRRFFVEAVDCFRKEFGEFPSKTEEGPFQDAVHTLMAHLEEQADIKSLISGAIVALEKNPPDLRWFIPSLR